MESNSASVVKIILFLLGLGLLSAIFDNSSSQTTTNNTYHNNSEIIVNCNLGKCGYKQLTSNVCKNSVCCQVGLNYYYTASSSECTIKQEAYTQSLIKVIRNNNTKSNTTSGCCKICTTGKACGDSCINRSYTCHKGTGCACNG